MRQTLTDLFGLLSPEHLFLVRVALAALLFLAAMHKGRFTSRFFARVRKRRERKPSTWTAILARGFVVPAELLLRLIFLYMTALLIPFPDMWTQIIFSWLTPLVRALAVLLIAWGFWRASPLCREALLGAQDKLDIHANQTIGRFLENVYRVIVVSFAVLTVLDMFGVPVASLIAGAGLVGLAISLAAQSTLTNLIAGIMLVLEHPFAIGDFIILGEFYGTVEDISFRSTRLRTPDNVVITVENTKVCSEYIQNGTERDSRLWEFTVRVSYDTPLERVGELCDAIHALFEADPDIKPDPLVVTVDQVGEDGVKLLVRAYTSTADYIAYLHIRDRLNRQILTAAARLGCELCYPPASVKMDGQR